MQRIIYALMIINSATVTACALDDQDEHSTQLTPEQSAVTPAAVATGFVCESYGGQRCIGAPTIAFEDPVVETAGGRVFQQNTSGNRVKFPFTASPNKCVAVINSGALVEVRSCDVPSAVWIAQLGPDGTSCLFLNQQFGLYLTGPNTGGQFRLETRPAPEPGRLQQFHFFGGLSNPICQ